MIKITIDFFHCLPRLAVALSVPFLFLFSVLAAMYRFARGHPWHATTLHTRTCRSATWSMSAGGNTVFPEWSCSLALCWDTRRLLEEWRWRISGRGSGWCGGAYCETETTARLLLYIMQTCWLNDLGHPQGLSPFLSLSLPPTLLLWEEEVDPLGYRFAALCWEQPLLFGYVEHGLGHLV